MNKVTISEPLYSVELTAGYDGNGTKIEQTIADKLSKYHHQIITHSVVYLIQSEIERIHQDFVKENPRIRKDVDYRYEINKSPYSVESFIKLGSRNGAQAIRFKPILSILTGDGTDVLPIKEL